MLAIATTFLTYIGYGTIITACSIPQASGNETEYEATINDNLTNGMMAFDNCTDRVCKFGTGNDQQVLNVQAYSVEILKSYSRDFFFNCYLFITSESLNFSSYKCTLLLRISCVVSSCDLCRLLS